MAAKVGKQSKAKNSPYMKDENLELRKVARALRSVVKEIVPGVKEKVNAWGIPTFEAPDPFCFYMVGKNHVTFGLHVGASLKDPEGLLEGTGKNIRHVKLRAVEDRSGAGLKNLG